jgi:hypothetical protein
VCSAEVTEGAGVRCRKKSVSCSLCLCVIRERIFLVPTGFEPWLVSPSTGELTTTL